MRAIGADDVERDDDGFIVLRPSADHVDQKVETLTTSIDSLEERLQALIQLLPDLGSDLVEILNRVI